MSKKIIYGLFCFVLYLVPTAEIDAQQDPMYNQYMFNTLPINPAYAGSREMLSIIVLGRQQWVGFEGAPNTATFSLHSPIYKNMAAGTSLIYDSNGPIKQTTFNIDYAYHIKTGDKAKLSLGLSGGFMHYSVDFKSLVTQSPYDNAYDNAIEQMFLPNVGFGLYLYSPKYYLGVSVPRILENEYTDIGYGKAKEVRHYYAMAGYVIHFSKDFALRPSVMSRVSEAAPYSLDFNLNAIFADKLWIGGMYRLNSAYGAMVQYQINPQLKMGYAFDMSTNELSSYHSGSHEVMINYELNFDKTKVYNPRYF